MKHRPSYQLLTFYKFVDIDNPREQVKHHLAFCQDIGIKWRIYISEEGISATLTCNQGQLAAYQHFLHQNPYFDDLDDQITSKAMKVSGHKFEKLIVRYRKEIVALWAPISQTSFEQSKQSISHEDLKTIIDHKQEDRAILDMRNSYEYKLWHFKWAIPAGTINFREVEDLLADYKDKFADKKVLMYCTWGIRCDKLSVLLKEKGIDNFYALDGGVVEYVNNNNDGNRLGNLYTFDGVISTKVGDADTHTTIGECIYSGYKTNNPENCRYSPCNARILARKKLYKRHGGFCSQACYHHALQDGLVKVESFDPLDYKTLRGQVKQGKLSQEEFLTQVREHLETFVIDKDYRHTESQNESLIDREYLSQWFAQEHIHSS